MDSTCTFCPTDITMVRGDSFEYLLKFELTEGEAYQLQDGDILRFGVFRGKKPMFLLKLYSSQQNSDGTVSVAFAPELTEKMKPGDYRYEAELSRPGLTINTVAGGIFRLLEDSITPDVRDYTAQPPNAPDDEPSDSSNALKIADINLLHNADWAYSLVNQRGHSGEVSNVYCIDRWIGDGIVTPIAGQHVSLAAGTSMTQRMEIIPEVLSGRECMFSIDADGEVQSVTASFPAMASAVNITSIRSGTVELGFIAGTFTLCGVSCAAIPYVKFTATSDISIRRIFIEPGAVSHMENAAVRDYGESLTICQRYETDLSAGGGTIVGTGVSVTSRMARILCSLPATMRVKPSLEIEDISGLALRISGSSLTPSAISVFGNSSDTYVTLNVTVSEDIESNQPCALVNATGTKIRLNSRL